MKLGSILPTGPARWITAGLVVLVFILGIGIWIERAGGDRAREAQRKAEGEVDAAKATGLQTEEALSACMNSRLSPTELARRATDAARPRATPKPSGPAGSVAETPGNLVDLALHPDAKDAYVVEIKKGAPAPADGFFASRPWMDVATASLYYRDERYGTIRDMLAGIRERDDQILRLKKSRGFWRTTSGILGGVVVGFAAYEALR